MKRIHATGHRDEIHAKLCAFLSQLGPEPIDTSRVGRGFPDCVWPFQGMTILFEFKGEKGELEPTQQRFFDEWRGGPIYVVRTEQDILRAIEDARQKTYMHRRVMG